MQASPRHSYRLVEWARPTPKRELIFVVAIAGLAFLLRVAGIDLQPLWMDEGYSVFFATRDLPTLIARTAVDIHPPLYYALLQMWISVLGLNISSMRLFSVFVGLATVPMIFLLGRELDSPTDPIDSDLSGMSRQVGLCAAFLLAISPLHVYYSQEVRMYGLATLLVVASIWLQTRIIRSASQNGASWALWVGYVLVTAGALYTHYYTAFVLTAEIVVVAVWKARVDGRLPIASWLKAWAAVGLLLLPWIVFAVVKLYAYVSAKVNIENYARLDPLTFLAQHIAAFSIGHVMGDDWLTAATMLFVALAAFGVARSMRATRHGWTGTFLPASLVYFAIPLLLGYLVNLLYPFHPIRYERLLLFIAPLFAVYVASGLIAVWQDRTIIGAGALVAVTLISAASLGGYYTTPRYPNEDYRPLFQEMGAVAQAEDVVLAVYPWQLGYMEAYYNGPRLKTVEVPSEDWMMSSQHMEGELSAIRSSTSRVWLLAYQVEGRILEDKIANFFADDYQVYDGWFGNTRLEYFAQASDPSLVEQPVEYGNDIELASYGASRESIAAGSGIIYLRLHWKARADGYSYSLRLADSSNATRLQEDRPILLGDGVERIGLFVPRDVSPGYYNLKMLVYHQANGLPVSSNDGESKLVLGEIPVTAGR